MKKTNSFTTALRALDTNKVTGAAARALVTRYRQRYPAITAFWTQVLAQRSVTAADKTGRSI